MLAFSEPFENLDFRAPKSKILSAFKSKAFDGPNTMCSTAFEKQSLQKLKIFVASNPRFNSFLR